VTCEVGPLPVMTTTVSRFPLATCITPKCATGLVLIGGSLLPLRFVPIGPFAEPVGIRPHWPVASPVRVRRLQNRMFGSYCSAEARNTKDVAFKLNSEYNPRSRGNGEGERRSQLTLGLHGYLGVRVRQRTGKV
jgi:hypothetical protein